jgi:DNA-binding NarL/FixJ family response regulator
VPGRAWQERSPIRLRTLQDGPRSPRRDAAAEAGLVSAVALPAIDRDDVLAVLEFYSRRRLQISERLVDSLTGIGHEIGQFLGRRRGELRIGALTQRELEVLQAAAHGNAVREIAETLVISPATVKSHLENIYAKLGVSDRAAAVARGLREGLIQ